MTADVFYVSSRVSKNRGVIQRFSDLVDRLGLQMVDEHDTVALKVHFGDDGTSAFVRPQFARKVVDRVKARGAHPFLTDTCTLYVGRRRHAVGHLELALENGFSYATVNAPLIIADGVRSRDVVELPAPAGATHFDSVRIGSAVHHADALLVLSKAKGHLAAGFGGAIKNLSMGVGSRAMKQAMHASVEPQLIEEKCEACGECVEVCAEDAVVLEQGIAQFDLERCVGCAECIAICPCGALKLLWNEAPGAIQEKMVEVAAAVLAAKPGKVAFYNFLLEVTPDCDCFPWSDNPVVNNVGVLASTDPVAIDQASADLINAQPGLASSKLEAAGPEALEPGADKFRALYPKIDWTRQLSYAEELGLGTRAYTLIEVTD
jgi:uncharacterized Fe-S center protein